MLGLEVFIFKFCLVRLKSYQIFSFASMETCTDSSVVLTKSASVLNLKSYWSKDFTSRYFCHKKNFLIPLIAS
jgi:hypothetical protein